MTASPESGGTGLLHPANGGQRPVNAALQDAFQRTAVINTALLKLANLVQPGLETQSYYAELDGAMAALESATTVTVVRQAAHRIARSTQEHVRSRDTLLEAREEEFNATVALLTEAVVQLKDSDTAFTTQVLDRSERVEKLIALDDLRTLRARVAGELSALRAVTTAKQEADALQIAALRGRVGALEARLSVAVAQAEHDILTGLYNRAAWEQRLTELVVQLDQGEMHYALAVIDLDNFKRINDTFGHTTGDAVLIAFGALCRQAFGADDFVARYGGDEFVVLLTAPNRAHAVAHLQRLITSVRRVTSTDYPPYTVSAGLVLARGGESVQALVKRADAALYTAKRAGRNRISVEEL